MKKDFETYLRELGLTDSLTPTERTRMRELLSEYARMKPARHAMSGGAGTFARFFPQPFAAGFAALLIFALSSTGIAYAAEGTLPGDPLYPVKVQVIEPIQTALITKPAEKVAWHMTLAERRIDEAAALAQKNALTPQTETKLEERFADNVAQAQSLISTDATSSTQIAQSAFATRLSAYDSVLAHIGEGRDASSTLALRHSIHEKIALIEPHDGEAMAAAPMQTAAPRAAMTFSLKATVTPQTKEKSDADLSQIDSTVHATLASTQTLIIEHASELDATSSEDVRKELARAKALTDQAKQLLDEGDKDGAYQTFKDALSAAARLDVLTRAAATLKVNAFTESIEATSTASSSDPAPRDSSHGPQKFFRLRGGKGD